LFDAVPFRQYLFALLTLVLGATHEKIEEGIIADIELHSGLLQAISMSPALEEAFSMPPRLQKDYMVSIMF
jgi:hypothetical protein